MSTNGIQFHPATTVVAIDFGSHGTGFGYSIDGGKIKLHQDYPDSPRKYPKTLTAILYRNREPISIGWTAQKEYEIQAAEAKVALGGSSSTSSTHRLIKSFKLLLHNPSDPLVQQLPPGITKIQVIADFLSLLKRYIFTSLRAEVGPTGQHLVAPGAITWVVTVPALWTDAAKSDMREAFVRAGIIKKHNPEQLVIALEPEAAALWAKRDNVTSFEPGQVVMVLDAGGGTVDWTVHNCVERGGETVLAEATASVGEMLGSLQLDLAFLALFKKEVGSKAYDAWHGSQPLEVLRLQNQWENIKCNFDNSGVDDGKRISIPPGLHVLMTSEDKGRLLAQYDDDHEIILWNHTMRAIFDDTLTKIVNTTNRQLSSVATKVDKILLVGGFSSSVYMQQRLRREVNNPRSQTPARVLPVPQPYAAVLRGAVVFGSHPHLIHARRTRYSYGIRVSSPYVDGAPDKYWHSEKQMYYSDNFFSCFVEKGQSVEYNESVEHMFEPLYRDNTNTSIQIYAMDAPPKRFLEEDDNTNKVASMTVEHPRAADCLKVRKIQVTFHFGRAEVLASATEVSTQKPCMTTFKFASI